ncbi:MAG: excinuclease ABC subunit UvrC [Pseudomonadota bacterium]
MSSESDLSHGEIEAPEAALTGLERIKAYVRSLPSKPGVYRMIGGEGDVLYVGKAKDLKKRVTSYTKFAGHTNRIARMISETATMEFIVTESETEALLLEANLIKRLKPKFNVVLRDDKSFPFILVALDHEAPQLIKHRGSQKRKGHYFGPFASAGAVNRTLTTLQKAFLLRDCSDAVYESRTRPCLRHQIKRCSAPCVGYISKEAYAEQVGNAVAFLKGKDDQARQTLVKEMEAAAEALEFERAAGLRNRLSALSAVQAAQGVNPQTLTEADVVAVFAEGGQSCIQVFFYRAGQNWGNRAYFPRHDKDLETPEILDAFLAQFYEDRPAPALILTNCAPPNGALLEEALSLRMERRVRLSTPQRGEKLDLVASALENAREALGRRQSETRSQQRLLEATGDAFGLEKTPERIEVYDNSHIQGSNAVGGMIVAGPEGFEKAQYRKFNIKDEALTPGDDFGMMREVLKRRFARALKADPETRGAMPDVVLIDGGQGQLSAAQEIFDELGVSDVALVSIAKGPDRNAGRERFFMTGKPAFSLEQKSPVLYFLQRLRDEAHRYAIGSHRARRKQDITANPLDGIPGVGPRRKKALLHRFGSARGVARAKPADLASVEGVSEALAERIHAYFQER